MTFARGSFVKKIHCVDIWYNEEYWKVFNERMRSFIAQGRCVPYKMDSKDFCLTVPGVMMDVIYIDGNHEYEFVKNDIMSLWNLLDHGGILCGHDYVPSHPGVIRAVEEFRELHSTLDPVMTFIDGSWLIQKPS